MLFKRASDLADAARRLWPCSLGLSLVGPRTQKTWAVSSSGSSSLRQIASLPTNGNYTKPSSPLGFGRLKTFEHICHAEHITLAIHRRQTAQVFLVRRWDRCV